MKVRKFKIKIQSTDEAPGKSFARDFKQAWRLAEKKQLSRASHDLVITFPDISWLTRIFSPERIRLIQTIKEKQPESIYQLAKLLGRTSNNVLRDVNELAEFRILELRKSRKKKRVVVQPVYEWDGFDIAV